MYDLLLWTSLLSQLGCVSRLNLRLEAGKEDAEPLLAAE